MDAQRATRVTQPPRSLSTTLMIAAPNLSQYYCGRCGRSVKRAQSATMKCPHFSCTAFWNAIGVTYAAEISRTQVYDLLRTHPYMAFVGYFEAIDDGTDRRCFTTLRQDRVTRMSLGYIRYVLGQPWFVGVRL